MQEYKEFVGISSSIESFIYSLYVMNIEEGRIHVKKYLLVDSLKGSMEIIEQYTMLNHEDCGKQFSMAVCEWENCGIDAIAVHCENSINVCTKDGILCTIDKSDHNELFENTIQAMSLTNLTQQLKRNGVCLAHPMQFSKYSVLQLNVAIATKSEYYLDDIDYLKSYSFYLIIATTTESSPQEKNNYLVWKKFCEEKSIFINEYLTESHYDGYHYINDLVIDKLYYKDQSRLVFGASFEELNRDWIRAKEEELGESLGYRAIRDYIGTSCFFGNTKVICFYLDPYIYYQEEE